MASTSQRRQCCALAMIMMLGLAEARRVTVNIGVEKATSNSTEVDENALVGFSPRSDITNNWWQSDVVLVREKATLVMTKMNDLIDKIQNGQALFGSNYCILTCPGLWIQVLYHQWNMYTAAKRLISLSFGASTIFDADTDEGKPLATSLGSAMRKSLWTFVKAVDDSVVQRTLLTLLMAPLGLFRKVTGMSPLGLCYLKAAWNDIRDHDPKYKQQSTMWWSGMLAGCPDTPPSEAPFENEAKTAGVLDAMVLAVAKPEGLGLSDDEDKWAGQEKHIQCVKKLSRQGEAQNRELSIEKGIITWRSTAECDSRLVDRLRAYVHYKSFAMQFLTTPSGADADPVQFFAPAKSGAGNDLVHAGQSNPKSCIGMQNAYRILQFCAVKGEDMKQAKAVIDAHLAHLGSERALLAAASKVGRLVAAADFEGDQKAKGDEAMLKDVDDDQTGDTSVESLQGLGDVPSNMEGKEATEAREILVRVRGASALMATGQDLGKGSALLQEAFAAAHLNQHLSTIMRGEASQKIGHELSPPIGGIPLVAGGAIGIVELLLMSAAATIVTLPVLVYHGILLQTSERLEAYEDLKRNSTKLVFPHAPLA